MQHSRNTLKEICKSFGKRILSQEIIPAKGAFRVNDFMGKALSSDFVLFYFIFTQSALPLLDFFLNKAIWFFRKRFFLFHFPAKSLFL